MNSRSPPHRNAPANQIVALFECGSREHVDVLLCLYALEEPVAGAPVCALEFYGDVRRALELEAAVFRNSKPPEFARGDVPHARRNIESRAALDLQVGNVDRLPLVGGEFEKLCRGNVLARERSAENVPRRIPSRLECNLYNRLLVHREAAEVRRTRTARCVGLAHGKPVFARFVFEGGNRLFVFLYPESSRITVAILHGYAAYILVFVFSADILARRMQNVEEARADIGNVHGKFPRGRERSDESETTEFPSASGSGIVKSMPPNLPVFIFAGGAYSPSSMSDASGMLANLEMSSRYSEGRGRGKCRRKRKYRKQSGEKCFFHVVFCCCLLLL